MGPVSKDPGLLTTTEALVCLFLGGNSSYIPSWTSRRSLACLTGFFIAETGGTQQLQNHINLQAPSSSIQQYHSTPINPTRSIAWLQRVMQICYGTINIISLLYLREISKKYHTPFNFSFTLIQIGVPTHHNPVYLAAWVLGDADGLNSAQAHPGISKIPYFI